MLAALAGLSALIAILGLAVAFFLAPGWVAFEQGRSDVVARTGFSPAEVRAVTASILSDLVLGPPAFKVEVDGRPVLDAAERSHMGDVRNVLELFAAVVIAANVTLLGILVANRRAAWAWRAVARGSALLALATLVAGAASLLFFDALFGIFHLVFFPQGNFAFDPRTERLVQLFPDQFWSDTTMALSALVVVLATLTMIVAKRRAQRLPG